MKKPAFLTTLFCLLFAATVSAQSFGVRLGVNNTNVKFDVGNTEIDTDGRTDLMLGAFVNLPIGTNLFSIQPEINYLNRGYKQDGVSVGGVNVGDFETSIAYLDLGVLARLNFNQDGPVGFYVGAGPYFSYAVSGSVEDSSGDRDIDFDADRLNRSGTQVAGVAGVTFGGPLRFFAEARYMGALSNLSDQNDFDVRQRAIGLNGGIMIPLGN